MMSIPTYSVIIGASAIFCMGITCGMMSRDADLDAVRKTRDQAIETVKESLASQKKCNQALKDFSVELNKIAARIK